MYFSRSACGGSVDPQSVSEPIRSFTEELTITAVRAVEMLGELIHADDQVRDAALSPLSDADKLLLSSAVSVYDFVDEAVCGACPFEEQCAGEDTDEDAPECFSRDLSWAEEWALTHSSCENSEEGLSVDALEAEDHRAAICEFMLRLCERLPFMDARISASSSVDPDAVCLLVSGLSDADVACMLQRTGAAEPLCESACDRRDSLDETRDGVSVAVEPSDTPDDIIALCASLVAAFEISR